MTNRPPRHALLVATALTAVLGVGSARAEDGEVKLSTLERQIQAMQAELRRLKHDMAIHQEEVRAAAAQAAHAQATADQRSLGQAAAVPPGYALVPGDTPGSVRLAPLEPPGPPLPQGTFQVGGVRVTLGGYLEGAAIYRTRNEVADLASSFNTGIPLPNSQLYHENETRLSARQSRFNALVTANPDAVTKLTAYVEADFLGAAPTANSNESNSYQPRLRHAFAVYDRSDLGFYVLGGQTWSLLTMDKKGISYMLSGINAPLQIDAQNVVGFTWTRQPQFRIAKSFFNDELWLAASAENPQTIYYPSAGSAPGDLGTINVNNAGGSTFAPTVLYSTEVAPDLAVKAALDPGWGHYEVYGVARFIHDRISTLGDGTSHTVSAGGAGAAALLPIIPSVLDIYGSFLAGKGIGRYGSAQLPDAVIGPNGKPEPLTEYQALVGVIAHPIPTLDVYAYGGTEQVSRNYYDADVKGKVTPFGYGNPLYSNTGCDTELGTECVANTSGIVQGTFGFWWKFEKGPYGTMQIGPQYSYTRRTIFQGIGPTPKTDDNMLFLSFRYYPFS
jgi:outer membrane murein-binding lipoprotein Lpp